jgi:hypothetical protein
MKNNLLLLPFLALFSFPAMSQAPGAAVVNPLATQVQTDTAGIIGQIRKNCGAFLSDLNYEFYPTSEYIRRQNRPEQIDTVASPIRSFLKKEGNLLSVQNLDNLSAPLYYTTVNYVGHIGVALIYTSQVSPLEAVIVSPLFGWAIVVFEHTDKQGYTSHNFGKCPALNELLK